LDNYKSGGEDGGANFPQRKKLIAESLELFSKRGYDGVSMRDIAAAVGIKGGFYL